MTDIIHEHHKEEETTPAQPVPNPAPEAPVDERTGQKRVYGYIILLFVVAFFLLLWSFLMNQRSNEQVISELRGNTGTIQSTLERNIELEQQIEALEAQIRALDEEKESLQGRLHTQEIEAGQAELARKETDAALSVYYAAVLAGEERYREAAEVLADWNTADFVNLLDGYDARASHYAGESAQPMPVRPYCDALIARLTELSYLSADADGQLIVTEPVE